MSQQTAYPAMVNSPYTTLSGGIDAATASIPVAATAYFPPAPNLATIISGSTAETVLYTGIAATALTGCTRGFQGAASAWGAGATIARVLTAYDLDIANANIADLSSVKASRTTGAVNVYVDKAATGSGTGVDWTNAFTTIQAAITSLPTILENDTTIWIRKGASDYAEYLTVRQIIGKGSLTIRGEFYWKGQCAAAATPATTKFNVTATDGTNIAVNDLVCVVSTNGTAPTAYVYSYVTGTVDKGSNVWEVTIHDAAGWGSNIGTNDYYRIVKTRLSPGTAGNGWFVVAPSQVVIRGIFLGGGGAGYSGFCVQSRADLYVDTVLTVSSFANHSTVGGRFSFSSAYFDKAVSSVLGGQLMQYFDTAGVALGISGSSVVDSTTVGGMAISYDQASNGLIVWVLIKSAYCGVFVADGSALELLYVTILSGTPLGILALASSLVNTMGLVTNQATTPTTPATSLDASYIN